jgi:hypothetical protein
VEIAGIQKALDDIRGEALVFHGFTDYMRDYDLIVFRISEAQAGHAARHMRYRFTHCVSATIETGLPRDLLKASVDDRLIEMTPSAGVEGFVWGARWQPFYPGGVAIRGSRLARRWKKSMGITMHEVRIQAGAHNLTLMFSDLVVTDVPPGYAPFAVGSDDQPVGPSDDE